MIVVIPCWRRPAHLAATLRSIEQTNGSKWFDYVFALDDDYRPEILDVISTFKYRYHLQLNRSKEGHGPASNVLAGWRYAFDHSPPNVLIGLIEEDILVAEDLFEFWLDAMEVGPGHAIGVSACRNQNLGMTGGSGTLDERAVYCHRSYQSLAVAVEKRLVGIVLDCLRMYPGYFEDQKAWCDRWMPDLPFVGVSQDGLFHRVIRDRELLMLYPSVPRAFHVGWFGYNRREGVELDPANWRADSERILGMSSDQMNELADPRFRDIEVGPLIRNRVALRLV